MARIFWIGCSFFFGVIAGFAAVPSDRDNPYIKRQGEGLNITHTLLTGQQAYFLENKIFTADIEQLGLPGLEACFANYCFLMEVQPDESGVIVTAMPHGSFRKNSYYTGAVFPGVGDQESVITSVQVCKSAEEPISVPSLNLTTGAIDCPTDSEAI